MKRLNYHHLRCFWMVARTGSISRASEQLGVSQPTVSEQVRDLEQALGKNLFKRTGRKLVMTDFGGMVFRHADKIFQAGERLMEEIRKKPKKTRRAPGPRRTGKSRRLR